MRQRSFFLLHILIVLSLTLLLGACKASQNRSTSRAEPSQKTPYPVITGTVSYLERMALPPDAVVYVDLYAMVPGEATRIVSTLSLPTEKGGIPVAFRIVPEALPSGGSYAVGATIEAAGKKLFASPKPFPIDMKMLRSGKLKPLEIIVKRYIEEAQSAPTYTQTAKFPGTFTGRADTPEGSLQMTLFVLPNHVFVLRGEAGNTVRYQMSGRWHLVYNGTSLQLASPGLWPIRLPILADGSLVLREIPADDKGVTGQHLGMLRMVPVPPNAKLASPWPQTRTMTGLYHHTGTQGFIRDCATAEQFQLMGGPDAMQLEAAYQKEKAAGAPLLVTASVSLPPIEPVDKGDYDVLRVEAFISMKNAQCPATTTGSAKDLLGDGRWKLLEAYGQKVAILDNFPEPHLVFEASTDKLFGSDGCNNFFGAFSVKDAGMSFSNMGSTMKMCPEVDQQAMRIQRLWQDVDGWRVFGQILELTSHGEVVAIFERVAL